MEGKICVEQIELEFLVAVTFMVDVFCDFFLEDLVVVEMPTL